MICLVVVMNFWLRHTVVKEKKSPEKEDCMNGYAKKDSAFAYILVGYVILSSV